MNPTETKALLPGLVIEDLSKIRQVGAPLWSPDRRHLLYQLVLADYQADDRHELIILFSLDTASKTTIGPGTAHAWSPDGREFLFETGDGALHIYNVDTTASRFLTRRLDSSYFINHLALHNCIWSPDGQHIAYISADAPIAGPQKREVTVIDDLLYKSKGGRGRPVYADHAKTHIYLVPATGGTPELLTDGHYNEHSITWSPDSRHIAFISNRTDRPDDIQQSDVWKVNTGTKAVTRLTDHTGLAYQPTWSPDGNYIAFLATSGATGTNDSPAEDTHIALLPANGGPFEYMTKSLDRRIEHIRWHPSGRYIYFTAGDRGDTSVYRISIEKPDIEARGTDTQGGDTQSIDTQNTNSQRIEKVLEGPGCISGFCLDARGDGLIFVKSDTNHPAEIFQIRNGYGSARPITQENTAWLAAKNLQPAETFWFDSFDGTRVQGWLIRPAGLEETRKYPLILVIHGGPHNMFGHDFDERMHLLSAAGYAVVYINPRGSHGYGQTFSNGTLNNWGGGDYQDLMAGIDFVLNRNPWLDAEKLGVTGQSYGGYMTNRIITRTTRFKAAVTDGGLSNLVSFAGTSLYHSLMESEFGGRAFDRFDLLWECSPLRNVARATTPTLFLHGETDNEVPFSQAEEMYIALKKKGVPTQLVQYTGEGHGWRPELGPRNKADLNGRMIAWFDQYIMNEP
ncbi:S9 family peptidase [Dyadobacter sp. 676]|uniref:S9 family peptidase n=1 Tax=Dyadobacter sp. 676 TaxID=3088362 RepID=A0AAU8FI37_9BACT